MSGGRRGFRRGQRAVAIIAAISGLVFCSFARANGVHELERAMIELHRTHAPAVVRVKAAITDGGDERAAVTTQLVFTGFFISKEGWVLTHTGDENFISRAARIYVEKDGVPYLATLIGADPHSNVALLQVLKLPTEFSVIEVAAPPQPPPIGSLVVSISTPIQLSPSPSMGIVTGFESFFLPYEFRFTYQRISIPLGPGEAGCPVLDMNGKLAGMAVSNLAGIRSSYAVPAWALARIVQDLAAKHRVEYATLPVEFEEHPDVTELQVRVRRVRPDSTAWRAGLRPGDVVRRVGSTTVKRIHDVRDALFLGRVGEFMQVEVERDGQRIPFGLPLEPLPAAASAPSSSGAGSEATPAAPRN